MAAPGDVPAVDRFLAGAVSARGLASLDFDGPLSVGLGIVVPAGDPVLEPCFALRERLTDGDFDVAWNIEGVPRFGCVTYPAERRALIRFGFAASLQWPRGRCGRIERAFLFDPLQVGAAMLRRFSQVGCIVWLVPERLSERERRRGGPGSAYDVLSYCLPLGVVTSDAPVLAIEQALAHVGLDDYPLAGST